MGLFFDFFSGQSFSMKSVMAGPVPGHFDSCGTHRRTHRSRLISAGT
jgi:hypothetical protein